MKRREELCLFSVGDIVKLKTGKSPQEVVEISERNHGGGFWGWTLHCRYLSSSPDYLDYVRRPRDQHDFERFEFKEREPEDQPKENMMTDLYQVKGPAETPRFGTKLAENSNGEYVLEMKGEDGKVEAFHPSLIDLVVPYTIQLVSVPPSEAGMHLQCEPGKLNKDDILLNTGNGKMFRVAALDTKNRSPKTGGATYFKLSGENVTIGNDN